MFQEPALCSSSVCWLLVPFFHSWATGKSSIFFIEIICWAPWILQVQSPGLPSLFLRAQPWRTMQKLCQKRFKYSNTTGFHPQITYMSEWQIIWPISCFRGERVNWGCITLQVPVCTYKFCPYISLKISCLRADVSYFLCRTRKRKSETSARRQEN